MVHRLAGGIDAVVTLTATLADVVMVKAGRQPGDGAMAILTLRLCLHMSSRHAPRLTARRMALIAVTHHRGMIQHHRRPGKGDVAVVAELIAGRVIGGLAGGDLTVMAGAALLRRALEYPLDMAVRAGQRLVLASERESRIEMIEVFLRRHAFRQHQQWQYQQGQQPQHMTLF